MFFFFFFFFLGGGGASSIYILITNWEVDGDILEYIALSRAIVEKG